MSDSDFERDIFSFLSLSFSFSFADGLVCGLRSWMSPAGDFFCDKIAKAVTAGQGSMHAWRYTSELQVMNLYNHLDAI